MKTELPKEELNLIAQIDARLKKLEQFMADVIGTPIATIEQVEQPKFIVKEEVKERFKTSIVTNHSKYEIRVFGFETQEEAIKFEKLIQNNLKN